MMRLDQRLDDFKNHVENMKPEDVRRSIENAIAKTSDISLLEAEDENYFSKSSRQSMSVFCLGNYTYATLDSNGTFFETQEIEVHVA